MRTPHSQRVLANSIAKCMPLEPTRRFGELTVGDSIAYEGYGVTFGGIEWAATKATDAGKAFLRIHLERLPSGSTVPSLPKIKTRGTLEYPYTTNPGQPMFPADLEKLIVPRPKSAHPLTWAKINPDWHYPTCCGRLWPCSAASDTLAVVDVAWSEEQKSNRCNECEEWLRGKHIQFGEPTPLKPGKLNPVEPSGPRLAAVGSEFTPVESARVVRFCHRSKCVTAARRFGELNRCPMPGLRKHIEAELKGWGIDPIVIPWEQAVTTMTGEYPPLTLVADLQEVAP